MGMSRKKNKKVLKKHKKRQYKKLKSLKPKNQKQLKKPRAYKKSGKPRKPRTLKAPQDLKDLEVLEVLEVKKPRKPRKLKDVSVFGNPEDYIDITSNIENVEEIKQIPVDSIEICEDIEIEENEHDFKGSVVEDILFKLPIVKNPFVGTPQQVQRELDSVVKKIQKNPNSKESRMQFDRIHLYMHGYLINIVLKQFPFIKGMQTVDIYQQTLYALWIKAIPGFKKRKGMSFLNFAKMCIRRHLITELNNSKWVQKHQAINKAVSLDSPVTQGDDDSASTLSNTVPDEKDSTDKITEKEEALSITKKSLMNTLSEFEQVVLNEYLTTSTYKEIAKNITKITKKRCLTKSVDNALLRIRKKAIYLKDHSKPDDVPLFIK
jgi:RNA polymerase sporulation-specific sigma factor